MLPAFNLVRYLNRLCSSVLCLQLLNAELVFAATADEVYCVFIDNGQNLQYENKLVSGVSKVSYILGYKNLRLKFSQVVSKTRGRTVVLQFTGLAEPVQPLRPWSDQKSCYLWSKSSKILKIKILKALVGPIIVKSRFFSNSRTNLALFPPPLV